MSDIDFQKVRKVFGDDVVALEEFSLRIPSPRLVVLVGPSGCGKTTLLRLIAGLEQPTSGCIMLGEDRLDTLPARKRDVAMVFQSYALYPHMTVSENLSFGLKIRRTPRDVIRERVREVAGSLDIDHLLDRRPAELSGGQRQRVALGRAVIREPKVFLFDEPLSNLDARLRDEMRYLIKRLYQRLKTTTVYVTHDQVEAMTIGETLVVLRDGRIHQVGSPKACYQAPHDTFVASFLGSPPMNLLDGRYDRAVSTVRVDGEDVAVPERIAREIERSSDDRVVIGVRPEDLTSAGSGAAVSAEVGLRVRGNVMLEETLGHETLTHVDFAGKAVIVRGPSSPSRGDGGRLVLQAPVRALHYFFSESGVRIGPESGPVG